jgi:hypothetical protein
MHVNTIQPQLECLVSNTSHSSLVVNTNELLSLLQAINNRQDLEQWSEHDVMLAEGDIIEITKENGSVLAFSNFIDAVHCLVLSEAKHIKIKPNESLLGGGKRKFVQKHNNNVVRKVRPDIKISKNNQQMLSDEVWVPVTLTYIGTIISSDAAGLVQERFSFNNPTRMQNGTGTAVGALNMGATYDLYSIHMYENALIPLFPRMNTPLGVLVTCRDADSSDLVAGPNLSNAFSYGNKRILDAANPGVIRFKPPKLTAAKNAAGGPCDIVEPGFFDAGDPPVTGDLYLAGANFPANTRLYVPCITEEALQRLRR